MPVEELDPSESPSLSIAPMAVAGVVVADVPAAAVVLETGEAPDTLF